jgi:HAD superfamily hydrolase (TIGR01509 family)
MIHYNGKKMEAVIFDMDRLLVDTTAVWELPAKSLMNELGLTWTVEVSLHYRGMDAKGVVETIFRLFSPSRRIEECHAIYRKALLDAFASEPVKPLPGANELLSHLRGKVPMAIASGSPPEGIERVLDATGWRRFFDEAISSERVGEGRGKPFPDVFLADTKALGHPPARSLVVEDALEGVRAALAAGCECAAVPSADSGPIERLSVSVFDTLADIIPALS